MSYTALYRKWRPAGFNEVKGQDAIVRTLKNEIRSGRVGHAYLFCGTRGTGKTSVAKIFARAVNCEDPIDGEPCGKCAMCRAISVGSAMNVVEMDAASNNGVDNVREIRDEVQYPPSEGRYRVYIIDEVHMLSTAAFNALLKTLEEPPAYVIFILATTEPHKIPATILSRCQQFDFRRIGPEFIEERLNEICSYEHVSADEDAIRYIVRKADGAMRDAISLLDQVIAFNPDQQLTYEKALTALGAVDSAQFSAFVRHLLAGDAVRMLALTEEIVMEGKELSRFTQDLIWYLRNLLLVSTAPVTNTMLEISDEDRKRLEEEKTKITPQGIMRLIRIYSELYNSMRQAVNKRVLFEVSSIKAMEPEMEADTEALTARIDALTERTKKLEASLKEGMRLAAAPAATSAGEPAPKTRVVLPRALFTEWSTLQADWPEITGELEYLAKRCLSSARLEPKQDGLMNVVLPDADADIARVCGVMDQLSGIAERRYDRAIRFQLRTEVPGEAVPEFTMEDIADVFRGIEIETEGPDDGWDIEKGDN